MIRLDQRRDWSHPWRLDILHQLLTALRIPIPPNMDGNIRNVKYACLCKEPTVVISALFACHRWEREKHMCRYILCYSPNPKN